MFLIATDWNPLQSRLKEIILKKELFEETKRLLLQMHSLVHSSEVYGLQQESFMDEIWNGLEEQAFRNMPTVKDDTIAWNIWHITRIEDLTSNYLIANDNQVLDQQWLSRLVVTVTDTGNAMSDDEIIDFSNRINRDGLYEYRNAVGKRTKEIIENLKPEDMKRKISAEGLKQIEAVGGVTEHPDSVWLLDFWGRKNVAGIFTMPVTRHQIVHLNDCRRLKEVCNRKYGKECIYKSN